MNGPIFIVGANRSGTTLLRLILNAHSRIAIPEELIYFDSYLADVPIEDWRAPQLETEAYAQFVDHFLKEECGVLGGIDIETLRHRIVQDGPHDFRHPYQAVLEAWAQSQNAERWGEKTPGNLFFADIIIEMFSDAQFIYMVRDPRAGVASMQKVDFFPDDIVFNALSRRKHATVGRDLFESHVPPEQRMTLRYEDLVREPDQTVRSVCSFLDEAYEPSMLHFHRDAEAYMKESAAEDFNAAATSPITDDHVDQWKTRLPSAAVAQIEAICAEEMRTFNYSPTRPPLPTQARLELYIKRLYWRWKMWQHRDIRQYMVKSPMFARTRTRLREVWRSVE